MINQDHERHVTERAVLLGVVFAVGAADPALGPEDKRALLEKRDAMSTAAKTSPPGLPLRSRTTRWAPSPLSLRNASLTSCPPFSSKPSSRRYPVDASSIRTLLTDLGLMKSCFTETVIVCGDSLGPRSIAIRALLPFSPSSRNWMASARRPATEVSLMESSRSPAWTPARAAGLPESTVRTVGTSSTSSSTMPVPATSPPRRLSFARPR